MNGKFQLGLRSFGEVFLDYRFEFISLQLAMRRYLYGPAAGVSSESLSYTHVTLRKESYDDARPGRTYLFSIEAEICSDPPCLCLRTQDILCIHLSNPLEELVHFLYQTRHYPLVTFDICSDLSASDLLEQVRHSFEHEKKAPSYGSTCTKCNADFQINFRTIDSDLVLVVTRWVDLGPGLSPDDRRWSVHSWDSLYQEQEPLDACDMEISPRAAFEKKALRNVEELQSYNLHCLEKQRYKKFMHRLVKYSVERDFWYLTHECTYPVKKNYQ